MKTITIGLILFSLMLASGCSAYDESIDKDNQVSESLFTKSPLERQSSPEVGVDKVQTLAQDNTTFALAFYDQIRANDGNIIFSPISLSLALSMTMVGAETSTKAAMMDALQMSLPESEIHPAFNALLLAIEESQQTVAENTKGNNFQLNIANAIWGQVNYKFNESFLDTLALNYGTGIYTVDFAQEPDAARNAINQWVEDETEEKIQDLIPQGAVDTLTRLVLANAIYFNGSWLHPFNQSETAEDLFTTLDGTEISVDMMKLFDERLSYIQGQNYQAVNLPYLSPDFTMTLLVPDIGYFSELEDTLISKGSTNLISGMSTERVDLQMPKFDFDSTINANDAFLALGMADAFDPKASDFSGIAEVEDLHITDVLHKAIISVDEEGTEAAAATAVIIGVTSAPPEDPISLVIDRPFLFLIQHQPTGSILFMGRVSQP
jgi:serpin B